jgi:hypothetical protein
MLAPTAVTLTQLKATPVVSPVWPGGVALLTLAILLASGWIRSTGRMR